MEITSEGDPISIAEKRTLAQAGRKIVVGSTPHGGGESASSSGSTRSQYQRVYEVPCPSCGAFHEVAWEDIVCEVEHDPDNGQVPVPELRHPWSKSGHKPWMVANGRWRGNPARGWGRITVGTGSTRSCRYSQTRLGRSSWLNGSGRKRGGPAESAALREPSARPHLEDLDQCGRRRRAPRPRQHHSVSSDGNSSEEESIPRPVLLLTVGADVQDDRIEGEHLWFGRGPERPYVLGRVSFDGNTLDDAVWSEL